GALTKQLERYAGNELMQSHLRGKLGDLSAMLGMARDRGVTGEVAPAPTPLPASAPTAAPPLPADFHAAAKGLLDPFGDTPVKAGRTLWDADMHGADIKP